MTLLSLFYGISLFKYKYFVKISLLVVNYVKGRVLFFILRIMKYI